MIDDLFERAKMRDIFEVEESLGARLKPVSPTERAGPCLVCGGTDRHSANKRKQVWNCRGCGRGGDVVALVQHILGLSPSAAAEWLIGELAQPNRVRPQLRPQETPQRESEPTNINGALQMWSEGVNPRGTPTEAYLNNRGLSLPAEIAGEVLRYHPGEGTMLALFRDVLTDAPKAISRTFIDRKTLKRLERKFLGPVSGCAVKLDPDQQVFEGLHIGEGIETVLTGRQEEGLRPAWALGFKGAISTFPILLGVEALTILAEPGAEKEVNSCAARWHAAGREVNFNWSLVGSDLNDALMARRRSLS